MQTTLELPKPAVPAKPPFGKAQGRGQAAGKKPRFPSELAEQARAVRTLLVGSTAPLSAQDIARSFASARIDRVHELLATLVSLGQARKVEQDRFVA